MQYLFDAACGGIAGMAVDAVLFPLDTIKTRMQARKLGHAPKFNIYKGARPPLAGFQQPEEAGDALP